MPFSVSFIKTFVNEVPPTNPLIEDPLSFTALITALTGVGVTLEVLLAKFGSKFVPVIVAVLVKVPEIFTVATIDKVALAKLLKLPIVHTPVTLL